MKNYTLIRILIPVLLSTILIGMLLLENAQLPTVGNPSEAEALPATISFLGLSIAKTDILDYIISILAITVTIILGIVTYYQANTQTRLDMVDKTPFLKLEKRSATGNSNVLLSFKVNNPIGILNPKAYIAECTKRKITIQDEIEIRKDNKKKLKTSITTFQQTLKNFKYTSVNALLSILKQYTGLYETWSSIDVSEDFTEQLSELEAGLIENLTAHCDYITSLDTTIQISEFTNIKNALCSLESLNTDNTTGFFTDDFHQKNTVSLVQDYITENFYEDLGSLAELVPLTSNLTSPNEDSFSFEVTSLQANKSIYIFIHFYSVYLYPYTQVIKLTREGKELHTQTAVFNGIRNKLSKKEFNKYFN